MTPHFGWTKILCRNMDQVYQTTPKSPPRYQKPFQNLSKKPWPLTKDFFQEYARINTEYNSLSGLNGPNGLIPDRLDFNRTLPDKDYARKDLSLEEPKNYAPKLRDPYLQIQEYASPNLMADYAEVEMRNTGSGGSATGSGSSAPGSGSGGSGGTGNEPEPYATTTLVTGNRRNGSSLVSFFFFLEK